MTVLALRFVKNSKRKVKCQCLKLIFIDRDEIQSGQNLWLKVNQRELSHDGIYLQI